jgi:acetyl-CoA acetyltransferase family protein
MKEVVMVDGVRTAIGRMGGGLAAFRPEELGSLAIRALMEKTKMDPEKIDDVLMGLSNSFHAAYHPARWAALKAGLPYRVPAVTVERACASSLQAVNFAAASIMSGWGDVYIAGGMESWSQCPWMLARADAPYSFVPPRIIVRETAPPPDNLLMGLTAESLAEIYQVSRQEQDLFGLRSQERALKAIKNGYFKEEIFPVSIPQKKGASLIFETDEHPRETSLEKLQALKPAFKPDGTVTAATATGRNDGAAAVLVMSRRAADELEFKPLGRYVTSAVVGVDPKLMGIGPAFAIPKCLKQANLKMEDMDVVEINEAFAAQVLADLKELEKQGIKVEEEKLNPNGGAIALGHPNGMTGARLALTLLLELRRRGGRYGLASLCIGGGQGLATIFEHLP